MTKRNPGRRELRAGYSLVEVTLALLVVAIGLTATFALFPEGLRAARAAVDDTEIGMFAEYVFTTMDLAAGKVGADWDVIDTDEFRSLMLSRHVSASNFELRDGGGVEVFYWYPDYYGLQTGDYAASGLQGFWTSAFTYTLDIRLSEWKNYGKGVTTYALLKVWPGKYEGTGTPKGDPRIFYREILPLR
ncbi:MAG TPA: hypothetical protein PL039_07565 [Kiritimatiellia bacterium]|nr:hypothetical protein [Kiritimatiellia bacterium]HQQ60975.1 hypothetical protein [Kiritimatiellia bacterium]